MKYRIILLLFLVGCKRIEYVKVEVPVPIPCPEPPAKRELIEPLSDLQANATDEQKAKAIKATIVYLRGRWLEAETILDGYRRQDGRANGNPNSGASK